MRSRSACESAARREPAPRAARSLAMHPASRVFTGFAGAVSKWTGRPLAFVLCVTLVVVWAVSGPLFGFSDTWQLVINTTTTIVTFLMVFLIQNTQNRDNAAIQAKLDELIRAGDSDNEFIGIEHLPDEELETILRRIERNAVELHNERAQRHTRSSGKAAV